MTLATALRRSPIGGNLPTFVASEWADTAGLQRGLITIPKPAGTTTGDLMVAAVAADGVGGFSFPAGWTEVADLGSGETCLAVGYKITASGDGSSFAFTKTGGPQELGGYIQTWRNADFDVVGDFVSTTESNNDIVIPGVTPTGAAILLAFVATSAQLVGYSTPSGMSLRDADNTYEPSMAAFYQAVGSGATGSRTSTADTNGYHRGIMLAIKGA